MTVAVVAQEPDEFEEEQEEVVEAGDEVLPLEPVAAVQRPAAATHKYLPRQGDFALGADATPFLNYLGGFFSDNGAATPTFSGLKEQSIYGKYFVQDNQAIRVKLLLGIYSTSHKQSVQNDEASSTIPDATTIDTKKEKNTNVYLSAGYEFRRGRGRVQGFWGGELGFGIDKSTTSYAYGNPMTGANQTPTSHNFGSNIPSTGERVMLDKGGLNFRFGLGGFAGVEYFIANQISLGGEFSLGFITSLRGQDEVTTQKFEAGKVQESVTRTRNAGDVANEFGVKTVAGGSIFLLFYF
jgi:hypothetical protein